MQTRNDATVKPRLDIVMARIVFLSLGFDFRVWGLDRHGTF